MKTCIVLIIFGCLSVYPVFSQESQPEVKNDINELKRELKSEVNTLKRSDRVILNKLNKTTDDILKQVNALNTALDEKETRIADNASSIENLKTSLLKNETETKQNILEITRKCWWNRLYELVLLILVLGFSIFIIFLHRKRINSLKVSFSANISDMERKIDLEHKQLKNLQEMENNAIKEEIEKHRKEIEQEIRKLKS